jgi:hypothetical protein
MAEPTRTVATQPTAPLPWRTPIAEWQRGLDEHDAQLAPEFKQNHPILSMEAIKQQHPDRWLALLITRVDDRGAHVAARVVDSAGHDDREALEERVKPSGLDRPEHPLCYFYTGVYGDFGAHW